MENPPRGLVSFIATKKTRPRFAPGACLESLLDDYREPTGTGCLSSFFCQLGLFVLELVVE